MKTKINTIILLTLIMVFCFGTTVYATPKITTIYKDGVYTMPDRHVYVFKNGKMQYGWVNYKDRVYYCHKTGSKKYPKGSATVSDFRIIDGKWFYFNGSGEIVKRDWYITVGNRRKGNLLKRIAEMVQSDIFINILGVEMGSMVTVLGTIQSKENGRIVNGQMGVSIGIQEK